MTYINTDLDPIRWPNAARLLRVFECVDLANARRSRAVKPAVLRINGLSITGLGDL